LKKKKLEILGIINSISKMLSRISRIRISCIRSFGTNPRDLFKTHGIAHNNHCLDLRRKPYEYNFINSDGFTYDIKVDTNGKYVRVFDTLQRTGKQKSDMDIEYTDPDGLLYTIREVTQEFKRELREIYIPYTVGCRPWEIFNIEGNINGVHIVKKPLNLYYMLPSEIAIFEVPQDSVIVVDYKNPTLMIGKFRASRVIPTGITFKRGDYGYWTWLDKYIKVPDFKPLDIDDHQSGIHGYFNYHNLIWQK